jgi:hypothetical protein
MRKVAVERKGETNFFTSQNIKDCMKKVIAVNLHQVNTLFLSPGANPTTLEFGICNYNAIVVEGLSVFHIKRIFLFSKRTRLLVAL